MKSKRVVLFFLGTVFLTVVFSCHGKTASSSSQKLKVGVTVMDMSNPYFTAIEEGSRAFCEERGYELTVVDGRSDPQTQVTAIENFIASGCKLIAVYAVDGEAVTPAVKSAISKGIFVNTYPVIEAATSNQVYDEVIWGKQVGLAAAKWINEKHGGKAQIGLLTLPTNSTAQVRITGIKEGVLELAPNSEFVAELQGDTPETGMSATENILQAYPNVKLILANTDAGALGAFEAVTASQKGYDFFIGGCDGSPQALDYILQDTAFKCSAASKYLTEELGYRNLRNIEKAMLGEPHTQKLIVDIVALTRENAGEYRSRKPDYAQFR